MHIILTRAGPGAGQCKGKIQNITRFYIKHYLASSKQSRLTAHIDWLLSVWPTHTFIYCKCKSTVLDFSTYLYLSYILVQRRQWNLLTQTRQHLETFFLHSFAVCEIHSVPCVKVYLLQQENQENNEIRTIVRNLDCSCRKLKSDTNLGSESSPAWYRMQMLYLAPSAKVVVLLCPSSASVPAAGGREARTLIIWVWVPQLARTAARCPEYQLYITSAVTRPVSRISASRHASQPQWSHQHYCSGGEKIN